jgi:hypothetical protein
LGLTWHRLRGSRADCQSDHRKYFWYASANIADGVDGSRSRHLVPGCEGCQAFTSKIGAAQMEISTIGLDLAKSIFQVHGVDAQGTVTVRKALRRSTQRTSKALQPVSQFGTRLADTIRASSPFKRLHQQAGQKSAPDQRQNIDFVLATREPSTEDVKLDRVTSKLPFVHIVRGRCSGSVLVFLAVSDDRQKAVADLNRMA